MMKWHMVSVSVLQTLFLASKTQRIDNGYAEENKMATLINK